MIVNGNKTRLLCQWGGGGVLQAGGLQFRVQIFPELPRTDETRTPLTKFALCSFSSAPPRLGLGSVCHPAASHLKPRFGPRGCGAESAIVAA
ncbi:hypothetical protein MHYP_G00294780 [Metynnis hypsauchen]